MFKSKLLSTVNFIDHAFFGRNGGVSTGTFSSLNFSFNVGDIPEHVIQNRQIIADKFNLRWEQLIVLKQIHSTKVLNINSNELVIEGDGLIMNPEFALNKQYAIGVVTADCMPLLFVDTKLKLIAAVHAGWRGLINGILENTIVELSKQYSLVHNLLVAIGPSIRQKSYEVDEKFYNNFVHTDGHSAKFFTIGNKNTFFFDFSGYAVQKLKNLGLQTSQIDVLPNNTYIEEENFFSHRRSTHKNEATRGLQASVILLK